MNTYKKPLTFLVIFIISLTLTACGADNLPPQSQQSKPDTSSSSSTVGDEPWYLYSINGQVVNQSKITLMLEDGERVSGYAGCNRYFGAVSRFSDGTVSIKSIATTKRACSDQHMNKLEYEFVKALEESAHYELTTTQLRVSGANSELVFLKRNPL